MKVMRVFWSIALSLLLTAVAYPDTRGQVTTQSLSAIEQRVQEVARRASPATVSLTPLNTSRRDGIGSGVVVNSQGLILTAAHVTMEMGQQVAVIFPDGERATGRVLGLDFSRDAGMVQIDDTGRSYPYVELGDSSNLQKNQWCVALGHSGGYVYDRPPPVRLGRVIDIDEDGFIMSNSALIGGDSGGPLFDLHGRVIGIHSNIGHSLSQNNHVPISTFVENWDRMLAGKRFGGGFLANLNRPMIGAQLTDRDDSKGVTVRRVKADSPASRAGLKPGDIIVAFGGKPVKDVDQFIKMAQRHEPGEIIQLTVKSSAALPSAVSLELVSAKSLGAGGSATPSRRPLTAKQRADRQKEFNEKIHEALRTGALYMTPGELERYGGSEELATYLKSFTQTERVSQRRLQQLLASILPPRAINPYRFDPDRPALVSEVFHREVLAAFRPSQVKATDAAHYVFRGNEWVSMATAVHRGGYLITKASEIEGHSSRPLQVLVSKNRLYRATVVQRYREHDLALIRLVNGMELEPIVWDRSAWSPAPGSLVSAVSSSVEPFAMGVVSVRTRDLSGKTKGFLGIETGPHSRGVVVKGVMPGGNAAKYGVRAGDVILSIDGYVCDTPDKLIRAISSTKPGQQVRVSYLRNGEISDRVVTLGDRERNDRKNHYLGPRQAEMERMGTEVSHRSTGFSSVIQTDIPLRPEQCGSPLVDLRGNVIGINIARAGRTKSYAIPAAKIMALIAGDLPPQGQGF